MLFANDGCSIRQLMQAGLHASTRAVWLDLESPSEQERETAERLTGLTLPSRAELEEIESSSRLRVENGTIFCSLPYSYLAPDGHSQVTPVGVVVSRTHLVTLRYASLPAFETYAERFSHAGATDSATAFAGLAEAIVDRVADVLERVAGELDRLAKDTFRRERPGNHVNARRADRSLRDALTTVGGCTDTLGNLRDLVLTLGRMAAYVQQLDLPWIPAELKGRLATIRQDVVSLNDYEQQLNNKAGFMLDAILGFINIEQNNTVKLLTVASVIGIPPTFVVGLYGMNFKNMPEYDWAYGYEFGWAMIIVSVVVPLIWLRVKGWL